MLLLLTCCDVSIIEVNVSKYIHLYMYMVTDFSYGIIHVLVVLTSTSTYNRYSKTAVLPSHHLQHCRHYIRRCVRCGVYRVRDVRFTSLSGDQSELDKPQLIQASAVEPDVT